MLNQADNILIGHPHENLFRCSFYMDFEREQQLLTPHKQSKTIMKLLLNNVSGVLYDKKYD
ncbi:hypothetical protein SAMN02910398_00786 [Butyrivibrio sp. YAB3001]|nr:hypothetical protein SAMN02910398_00786 [Butyrivibrio sp. YAB3001]